MARFEFRLPDIGEGIAEAEIVAWHVKVGDMVKEDQQIADMMTDKATVEMESPVAGKVVAIAGEVGDQVAIGSILVEFEIEGEAPVEAEALTGEEAPLADGLVDVTEGLEEAVPSSETAEATPQARPAVIEAPAHVEAEEKKPVLASPAVRQRARDLGIDLAEVKATGDRVRHADLDAFLLYNGGAAPRTASPRRQDEQVKVVGLRRKIAENMQEAKRRIPHFTYVDEVDVTALEQTRA
ncbi:MAG TPA: biotin/lipoyl-containing protein, partial [Allosphingosinicella sp.]